MTLTITETDDEAAITSDTTSHWAVREGSGAWLVSWLPERMELDRNQAITAMNLAETVAPLVDADTLHSGNWPPQIDAWATELGLTGPDAVVRTTESPHT